MDRRDIPEWKKEVINEKRKLLKNRQNNLKSFLAFLKENLDFDFDVRSFNDRIKLQKYVFIAKSFNFDNNYGFNLYIRGPYSTNLADDYYNMDLSESMTNIPDKFLGEDFKKLVQEKDLYWLEAAATMISLNNSYRSEYNNETDLVTSTHNIKNYISKSVILDVFETLKTNNLINN